MGLIHSRACCPPLYTNPTLPVYVCRGLVSWLDDVKSNRDTVVAGRSNHDRIDGTSLDACTQNLESLMVVVRARSPPIHVCIVHLFCGEARKVADKRIDKLVHLIQCPVGIKETHQPIGTIASSL